MYRFFAYLFDPYTFLLLVLLVGVLVLWRRRKESRKKLMLISLPVVALTLLSLTGISFLLVGSLEWDYPPLGDIPKGADGIVVLSGGYHLANDIRLEAELGSSSMYRCVEAARLYHRLNGCPVIVTGGKEFSGQAGPTCAEVMRDFLVKLGVRRDQIIVEDAARTTFENAANCRAILDAKKLDKVLLVTEAIHMKRAVACFHSQEIDVVPAPCHHLATQFQWGLYEFFPKKSEVGKCSAAMHEWFGLAWYSLTGKL